MNKQRVELYAIFAGMLIAVMIEIAALYTYGRAFLAMPCLIQGLIALYLGLAWKFRLSRLMKCLRHGVEV